MQIITDPAGKELKKHGDSSFPFLVSYERLSGYETGSFLWHWHPEIELTWFVSGQMEYVVNDQRYIISEGEGIFCNSNALHAGYMIDDQDCNYISVTFHPKFIYGYENSILQTKYVDFITSNEFWSSLVLKPEIPWQNEIIEYIKEIYTLTCQVQSSSDAFIPGYEGIAEQPELPTKVQDIANGSDDLYGEGVPIEHGANPDERFSSGGVDHTHQYIVANALKILSNDKGNSAFNGELNSSILMEATDWPDKLGNETDAGTFAGHFYDPDTGKNWLGQKSPTARTRAESYFQAAVNAYRAGDVQLAMSNLGKGTHYVSDLNEPHHASNLTAINSNHSAFEKYVDKNRKSYTIAGSSFGSSVYTTALNTSTGDLMYSAAKYAKGLVAEAQKESSYDSAGRKSVQHAIQTVTQYMYKFGKEVGIY